jgi:predicted transposase YdaD
MGQQFDVSLKTLFRYSHGIVSRMLFGGPVVEWLNVEQPDVRNVRVDLLARRDDGTLRHVEFQTTNEPDMARRQADYYMGFWRLLDQHVEQVMLYLSREPLGMDPVFATPAMRYHYTIVNVRELDGLELLASEDWADNELALFTRVDREAVIQMVEKRLRELQGEEQTDALRTFVILSGILGIEDEIDRRLRMSTINLLDNKIIGPAIRQGLEEGRRLGRQEGLRDTLLRQIQKRFGRVPPWARAALESAPEDKLQAWTVEILDTPSLEALLK